VQRIDKLIIKGIALYYYY